MPYKVYNQMRRGPDKLRFRNDNSFLLFRRSMIRDVLLLLNLLTLFVFAKPAEIVNTMMPTGGPFYYSTFSPASKPHPHSTPIAAQQNPDVSPLLFQNSNNRNAGIFVRLMPTGLAYLREIGMKVVNDEVLKISLPTITEAIDTGQVSIYNAYVSKYWPPVDYSLDLLSPDTFTWQMSKMHIRSTGNFDARLNGALLLPTVPVQGEFETLLGHVGLTMSVRMLKTPSGAPQVKSVFCGARVGYVDLSVRNTGVITDFFINTFKAFLIAYFKPMVEQRVCKMIENVINHDVNAILSTMPLKLRINEDNVDIIGKTFGISEFTQPQPLPVFPFQPGPPVVSVFPGGSVSIPPPPFSQRPQQIKQMIRAFASPSTKNGSSLLNFVNQLRDRNLVLDFALLDEPFVSHGAILMKCRGEISFGGYGATPFYPPNVVIPQPNGPHMAEFFATDYIANSMLYHAYKHHYMDVVVGPESSPQLKDILQTSCPSGFCIGEFLGNLAEAYPNRKVEIHFAARKAPVMVFVESRARFRLHGRMDIYVRPVDSTQAKVQVVRSETTMTSNVNMWIHGQRIVGNASVENLDFRLVDSVLKDLDQSTFGDLGLFGAEFLEKLMTEILQMGMAIPTMSGVVIKSPKLSIHERYMRVVTYFKLDEQYAGQLVQGAVRQTLMNIG